MFAWLAATVRKVISRRRIESELDEELRFHIEMETRANLERGLSAPEARRVALADLGGVTHATESVRQVRTLWIESVWQDVLHACRVLRRRPGVSVAAIAMLALGIGITTAMFTVVDALILRPVPFPEPDQLAHVLMFSGHEGRNPSAAVVRAWRHSAAFSHAESADSDSVGVSVDGLVVARRISHVTPGLFDMLGGVRPILGRIFDASDVGGDRILLSEDFWRNLFHADPAIVGRSITIDGTPQVVVGVLPAEFRFPSWNTAIWQAVSLDKPTVSSPSRIVRFAGNIPRADALRVATDAARAADPTLAQAFPSLRARPILDEDPYYRRAMPVLAGGVVLVFFVLCANVSSLLLARLTARQREFSLRSAIGASRGRLIRQAFVESAILGALGASAGIAIGWALVSLSRALLPAAFLLRTLNPLNIDLRALVVTSLAGLVATLAAGLVPAWIGTRVAPNASLRVMEAGSSETRSARATTRALLIGEIALACTLLVAATLLVRSFINLSSADRGLDSKGKLMAMIWLPRAGFPDPTSRAAGARRIEDEIRHLPGVQHVAWSYGLPPDGGWTNSGTWRSDAPGTPAMEMDVNGYAVGPEFFALYGIPLVRGRVFEAADAPGSVVVSERLARLLWPGLDPIGRTFTFSQNKDAKADAGSHVIGLVKETHFPALDPTLDKPQYYVPFSGVAAGAGPGMLSIQCGPACPKVDLLRQLLLSIHPSMRVSDLRLQVLEDRYFEQLARPRATAALGFAFAAIALLASAGGLFSVLSYAVARRKREFGIRAALGASPSQIRGLVLRDGLIVAVTGMSIGAATAWFLARTLTALQYGVTVTDPVTWFAVLGLLGLTTLAACWRPARQATRTDLVTLLREE